MCLYRRRIRLQQPIGIGACLCPAVGLRIRDSGGRPGRGLDPWEVHPTAGEDLYIVDLRSILEKDLSSIPGAIRLSVEDLTANSQRIPRDREIILFCS
jgi:hypothetical protein